MRKILLSTLMMIVLMLSKYVSSAQTDEFAYLSPMDGNTGTWTCPNGVTSITLLCWSGGGAGGSALGFGRGAGGGAGGTFSKKTLAVTPGTTYTYLVGIGGKPTNPDPNSFGENGGDTWFGSPGTVFAKGGKGGGNNSLLSTDTVSGKGSISIATNNIGDVTNVGGDGASGSVSANAGGGGGGAAGDSGSGGDAVVSAAGTGGAQGGAGGGNGATQFSGNQAGSSPGGGGGGAYSTSFAGDAGAIGGDGVIIILWTTPLAIHIESFTGNKTQKGNDLHLDLNATNATNVVVHLEKSIRSNVWSEIQEQKVANANAHRLIDFNDANPALQLNQYRIKVISDNKIYYSNIVAIDNSGYVRNSIKMTPNPANNISALVVESLTAEDVTIAIIDAVGKTIRTQNATLNKGSNTIQLNLSDVASGTYQISLTGASGKTATARFVK